MRDIAKRIDQTSVFSRIGGIALLCLVAATLTGCMGGLDIAGGMKVDKTATGSIPQADSNSGSSDALTVRDAVSSADVSKTSGNPIPWANSASGSAGVISDIAEEEVNGTVCRRFTTTRHSYQGIAKFYGNACLLDSGEWVMTSFAPRS